MIYKNKILYYNMTSSCKCILDSYNKKCFYRNPQTMPPLEYEYWNETTWLQQATVNHWGAFNQNQNSTADNLSGYGISSTNQSPSSKKLKRFYSYETFVTDNPSKLVYYEEDDEFIPISEVPNVKKFFRWVSV
jgi:hypothetical protein